MNTQSNPIMTFHSRRPILAALVITAAYLLMSVLFRYASRSILPGFDPDFVGLVALAVVVAIHLTILGWWRESGFNRTSEWRNARLMWFPFVVVLVLPFLRGIHSSDWSKFAYLALAYALTGFMEEGLMRGIVMRTLKPTGVNRSIVISALLFGLFHIGNLVSRNPAIVFAQMLGAFVHGIGLGAFRHKTNTIWFPVILHALHDLALQYSNFPTIPLDVVMVTLLMLYGIYLLRGQGHE